MLGHSPAHGRYRAHDVVPKARAFPLCLACRVVFRSAFRTIVQAVLIRALHARTLLQPEWITEPHRVVAVELIQVDATSHTKRILLSPSAGPLIVRTIAEERHPREAVRPRPCRAETGGVGG